MKNRQRVVSIDVDVLDLYLALELIFKLIKNKRSSYICLSNVHMCMEAFDMKEFRDVVNNSDLVLADGKPLSIAQRVLGNKNASQIRGQDIMNAICSNSGKKNFNVGFYGGNSNELLANVVQKLQNIYPDINITFTYSPPFRPLTVDEDNDVVKLINRSEIDVLFVGIGCPKQEIWMAQHKEKLNCVMLGVGAAFDFLAGSKKHAPVWMQKSGLEWLFRLASEPKRLWKRYLKQNPRFIYYFLQQWLLGKKFT